MKIAGIIFLVLGLVFVNLIFLSLLAMGSISMTYVETGAIVWFFVLLLLWICFLIPYVLFLTGLYKNRNDKVKLAATWRSIVASAWISLPGAIAVFILIGSQNVFWATLCIPIIQVVIASFTYISASKQELSRRG